MTVFEHFSLDTPLEFHKDSINCLENEIADLAWILNFVVDKQKAQYRLDTEKDEIFRLSCVEWGFVLDFEDVEEYFLFDFNDSLMVFKVAQKLREDLIKKDQDRYVHQNDLFIQDNFLFAFEISFQKLEQLIDTSRQDKQLLLITPYHHNVPFKVISVHQLTNQHEHIKFHTYWRGRKCNVNIVFDLYEQEPVIKTGQLLEWLEETPTETLYLQNICLEYLCCWVLDQWTTLVA